MVLSLYFCCKFMGTTLGNQTSFPRNFQELRNRNYVIALECLVKLLTAHFVLSLTSLRGKTQIYLALPMIPFKFDDGQLLLSND
jgi:hypothetical protein